MINTLSSDKRIEREAARIRRAAVEAGMPCLTSLDTAKALLMSLAAKREAQTYALATIDEHLAGSAK